MMRALFVAACAVVAAGSAALALAACYAVGKQEYELEQFRARAGAMVGPFARADAVFTRPTRDEMNFGRMTYEPPTADGFHL